MSLRPFFVQFFCVFLPPLLNIFCFCQVLNIFCFCPLWCRSLHESFLCYLIFLKRSLNFSHSIVFPLFVCTDHLGRLSYLSLLFFGTLHSNGYIFPFLLCLSLLFFSQLFVTPPQTTILPFCISFSWDGFAHCLLYNVTNLPPQFFKYSLYQI